MEALGIGPGDPVVLDAPFRKLAGTRLLGKAWDDSVGVAAVIEALRRLRSEGHPNRLFVAATVLEEVGLRGARTAADLIKPDIDIAIEGGIAGDSPGRNPEETEAVLGGAPTVNLIVPARYTHAHNGVIDRADFDRTVDLVVALIKRLDAATVARLRDFTPE